MMLAGLIWVCWITLKMKDYKFHKCEKNKKEVDFVLVDNCGNSYCGHCGIKIGYFYDLTLEQIREELGDRVKCELI